MCNYRTATNSENTSATTPAADMWRVLAPLAGSEDATAEGELVGAVLLPEAEDEATTVPLAEGLAEATPVVL